MRFHVIAEDLYHVVCLAGRAWMFGCGLTMRVMNEEEGDLVIVRSR